MEGVDCMKILVDADACPVKHIIERIAQVLDIPVFMFIDTSHMLESEYSKIVQVSKAPDAVDIAVMNHTKKGDIVVSQDYGVATMVLGKGAYAIDPNGKQYTNDNIEFLMDIRHISRVQRRAGKKTSSMKRRTKENDNRFEEAFYELCIMASNGE